MYQLYRVSAFLVAACLLSVLPAYVLWRDVSALEDESWYKDLPKQYGSKWYIHDYKRPKPTVVVPGKTAFSPPSDAVVLFDGTDLSAWRRRDGSDARWRDADGYMELSATGDIWTREEFGDCQLHIEWAAPSPPQLTDQSRGNSGIFLMDRYELQVLDSYESKSYADGYAGSVYGQHPPLANASRAPGEWQSYDIIFRAPRFKDGRVAAPARVTIFHNGVLVQHNTPVYGGTGWRTRARYRMHGPTGPIRLQDHGDKQKVRFRNIWVRRLELEEQPFPPSDDYPMAVR